MAKGYTVEIRRVGRASYLAKVRNAMDTLVGDLAYRDPVDEASEYAQGLSYSSYVSSTGRDRAAIAVAPFIAG